MHELRLTPNDTVCAAGRRTTDLGYLSRAWEQPVAGVSNLDKEVFVELQCGPWALGLPDGWAQREQDDDPSVYFSSPEEDVGIYISLYSGAEGVSAESVAAEILETHKQSFLSFEGYSWECGEAEFQHGATRALLLDMYAAEKSYAVHTLVGFAGSALIKLTVHHYLVGDEAEATALSRGIFATLRPAD